MALTDVERLLIRFLKESGMEKEETAWTVLSLETTQQQIELIKWIASKGRATPQEILNKTSDIVRSTN